MLAKKILLKKKHIKIPKKQPTPNPPDDNDYIYPNDSGMVATLDGRIMKIESLFEEESQFYHESTSDIVTYNENEQRYYLIKRVWSGVIRDWSGAIRCPIYVEDEFYPIGDSRINELMCAGTGSNPTNTSTLSINIENTVPGVHNGTSSEYITPDSPIAISTHASFSGVISTVINPNGVDAVNAINGKKILWKLKQFMELPLLKSGESVKVDGIKLNKSIIGLSTKETKKIIHTVYPPMATNKDVIWKSSDVSIATVKDGVITPLKEGNIKITAITKDGGFESSVDVMVYEPYTQDKLFNGAYIQIYYYEPKINLGEDLIIPYYITDEEMVEVHDDDNSKTFTLIVTIDGVETRFYGLKAGDQEVNLGKLPEGEHSIVFQGIDETNGSKGMAIYKEVWIVNPNTYPITEEQTHYMTQGDLTDFNINNQNSDLEEDCNNTRDGLNAMFNFYKNKGYRKLVMIPGTYRVNCTDRMNKCVIIPSEFTIDGNGCKFKRKPILEYSSQGLTIISWDSPVDTHLLNCEVEADMQERIDADLDWYTYDQPNGEGFNTLWLKGGRYSSIENITITNAVGHAVVNGGGVANGYILPKYEFDYTKPSIINSANSSIEKCFILNGEKVFDDKYLTVPMLDIMDWQKRNNSQYIIFGNDGGYSWFKGLSQYVYYHFYDEDGDFVCTIPTMQYRPIMIPIGCRYVRASMLTYEDTSGGAGFFYKEQGTHLSMSNNHFEDCRTTAYAPTCSRGLLMEKNNYVNCGRKITPCSVDFEDGWQQSIDVFYRNNDCTDHEKSSASVITVGGVNHVYESNRNHKINGKAELAGCVYRNCTQDTWMKMGLSWDHISRYNRIYNNKISDLAVSNWKGELSEFQIAIGERHAHITVRDGEYDTFPESRIIYETEPYYKGNYTTHSKIRLQRTAQKVHAKYCDIHTVYEKFIGSDCIFDYCNFFDFDDINKTLTVRFNAYDTLREFNLCNFKSPVQLTSLQFNNGVWNECVFERTTSIIPTGSNKLGDIQFNNCIFIDDITIKPSSGTFVQFNNCTFEGQKILQGATDNIEFNNCR